MRGQRLFNTVIKGESQEPTRKGRNDTLLELRNSCLLARYYYYGHFTSKCFEDILSAMVSEFFLTPVRISRIIQENIDIVKELKQKKMTKYQLQHAWPQYKW